MKMALIADLQFDSYHGQSRVHESGMSTRLVDMLAAWEWAVGESVKAGCERLLVLGDVFDSRRSIELPVIDGVCRAMHAASEKMELWVVVGNHDSFLRRPHMNSLQMFRGFAQVFESPVTVDGFALVPWHDDPTKIKEGVQALLKDRPHTLCTHGLVQGSHAGGATGFPLAYLQCPKFKRVFLGDVHDSLTLNANCQYVGSLLQIDYRDAGRKRGFVIYDKDKNTTKYVENRVSPQYHLLSEESAAVRARDFVRIVGGDSAAIVAGLKGVTPHVEILTEVSEDSDQARVRVNVSASEAEVLEKYVRYVLPEADAERVASLVRVGLTYLPS